MRVLVTGAARAIGRATVEVLAARGHDVVATARNPELLEGLPAAQLLELDVCADASVGAAVAAAGDIDAIVNNAGVPGSGPLETYPLESFRRVLEVNTLGPLRMAQAVAPRWRERGSGVLVNVSSVQGRDRHADGGTVRGVQARARGAVGVPLLRAGSFRDPRGHHRARLHRSGHEARR